MIGFVLFFGTLCFLGFLFGLRIYRQKQKKQKDALSKRVNSSRNRVLTTIYNIAKKTDQIAGMPVRKIKILEITNLRPKDLERIYKDLVRDKLVSDEGEGLSLTDFGKTHVEVFINQTR